MKPNTVAIEPFRIKSEKGEWWGGIKFGPIPNAEEAKKAAEHFYKVILEHIAERGVKACGVEIREWDDEQ